MVYYWFQAPSSLHWPTHDNQYILSIIDTTNNFIDVCLAYEDDRKFNFNYFLKYLWIVEISAYRIARILSDYIEDDSPAKCMLVLWLCI